MAFFTCFNIRNQVSKLAALAIKEEFKNRAFILKTRCYIHYTEGQKPVGAETVRVKGVFAFRDRWRYTTLISH